MAESSKGAEAESPEALEELGWAGWWADDAEAVADARERAYRLFMARGDAAGAGRVATWLACDELDFRGAAAVARGWLTRAHRLLDPLEPGPDHGWLCFLEGYLARGEGDTATARELARRTAEIGRRAGVSDLEMLGLALEGSALVACGRMREGMRSLDEATAIAMAGEATIPISSAWACCFLVSACVSARDYDRAVEWCDRIAEFAERHRSRYMLGFCRAEYGAVGLWRGSWDDAEAMLEASVDDLLRSRPAMAGGPLVALAELRRRQGRWEDAALLLDRAPPAPAARLCRARHALDSGRPAAAADLAERVLRRLPPGCELDRVPALELLVEARTRGGRLEEAASALDALQEVARRAGTAALGASADLAAGFLAAGRGEHESARPLLEDAVDGLDLSGGRFEAARAGIALAATLLALGRADAATREAAAALERLEGLGAAVDAERARRVLAECRAEGRRDPVAAGLTAREREVLDLIAEGLTDRQIAERLVLSPHTVHRHVSNILRKLRLPSRAAAVAHHARRWPV